MADDGGPRRVNGSANGASVGSMAGVPVSRLSSTPLDYRVVYTIQARVADELAAWLKTHEAASVGARQELGRQLIAEEVGRLVDDRAVRGEPPLPRAAEESLADAVFAELFGLGRLQRLVDDPQVENIEIYACDEVWLSYADGRLERGPAVAESNADLLALLQQVAARSGRSLSTADPSLHLALPGGARLAVMIATTPHPVVTIRKLRVNHLDLKGLARLGTLDPLLVAFLKAAIRARKNIVVTGEMNAGKTTLVASLAHEFPQLERFATIEKEYELRLHEMPERHPRVVAMQAREPNQEVTADGRAAGEVTLQTLVTDALRHNLTRIIVGEVRGDEALPMLEAMTVGGRGSLCTLHARTARHAIDRLVTLCLRSAAQMTDAFAYRLIGDAIDFVVHVRLLDERFVGGRQHRFVAEVLEVTGMGENARPATNTIFAPGPDGRAVPRHPPACLDELRLAGFDVDLAAYPDGAWPEPLDTVRGPQ